MPSWDAGLYMRFANERSRPCADLVARIALEEPKTIVDLGCGPGNSTEQLQTRWPKAHITGVDNSPQMLADARKKHPDWQWEESDISNWSPKQPCDMLFANAAYHWVPEHAKLFPRLFEFVATGGAFAAQMPYHLVSQVHHIMVEVSQFPEWEMKLRQARRAIIVETPEFYYDTLAPIAERVDIWLTTYHHEMDNASGILDWIRGSGMRPYLEALDNDTDRKRFQDECLRRFRDAFPQRTNGKIVLNYPRLFIIAYRK